MDYERVPPITYGKEISGYGIRTYCKIIEYNSNDPINYKRTFTFGRKMKEWCITASCRNTNPDHIYIDRVEAHDTCFISNKPIKDSTANIIRLALFVMYKIVPTIDRFTLKDDSYIYCNGKDFGPKISLAYETILKYNQTWYQKKFGAILDGFISQTPVTDKITPVDNVEHIILYIDGVNTLFSVRPQSMMAYYLKSLIILDQRCDSFEDIIKECPYIKKYEQEYRYSNSPRDFISKLREKFSKEEYCKNLKDWLHSYMEFLHIMIYTDAWFIPVKSIQEPTGFFQKDMSSIREILSGGNNKTYKSKKTRVRTHKYKNNCGIIPFRRESQGRGIPWDEI